jgi:hypothetical protein
VTDNYGIPFSAVQVKTPAPGNAYSALTKRHYAMLKRFQHAYAKYGGEEIVVGAVEAGKTCQPDTWLSRPIGSQGGNLFGYITLYTDKGNEVGFAFLGERSTTPPAQEAVTAFTKLAAQAGAMLRPGFLAALGVARVFEPAALWLTFLMSVLGESQFINRRRDCTLLVNPFAASIWAIEKVKERKESAKREGTAPAKPVAKRYSLAHESYEWACAKRPDLVGEGRGLYPPALYEHAKNHWPGYADAKMNWPTYGTWTRYGREYERLTTGRKNTPRSGRTGRSVPSQDDL